MNAPLDLAEVRAALPAQVVGSALLWYPILDSTQAELRRRAAEALPGTVLGAETQTTGQGRRGRTWDDRPGQDLLFSVLLPAPDPPPELLPVALGAGLAEALAEVTGAPVMSSWPNDLVCAGAKLAGLLVEQVGGRFLLGLGVNVLGPEGLPPRGGRAATTLEAAAGRELRREPVLAACLLAIEAVCREWPTEQRARVIAERDYLRGRRIAVERAGESLAGLAAGISPGGALLMRRGSETVEVRVADAVKVDADV